MTEQSTLKNLETWTDLLHRYLGKNHEPYIFFGEPEKPKVMEMRIENKVQYDFVKIITIMLSMIIEKMRISLEGKQSFMLKPANYKDSYLLARMRKELPELIHLRGISINKGKIIFSFNNLFDMEKLDELIIDNPVGFTFICQKEKIRSNWHKHYLHEGVEIFTICKHTITFPYEQLASQNTVKINWALEAFAELICLIHDNRTYLTGNIIYYHNFVPILKELVGENFVTGNLGELVRIIAEAIDSGQVEDTSIFAKTRKDKSNYRFLGMLPDHIKYTLFKLSTDEVIIGFDCPLNIDHINELIGKMLLLVDTEYFSVRLKGTRGEVAQIGTRTKFKDNHWCKVERRYNLQTYTITDDSNLTLMTISKRSIVLNHSAFKCKTGLVTSLLNAIYDNMYFYTNQVHTQELDCALTEVESMLIGAIRSLTYFYRLFALVRIEKESYRNNLPIKSELEWVLQELRASGSNSIYQKIFYVLSRIVQIGQNDIPIILQENEWTQQSHLKLISMMSEFERLCRIEQIEVQNQQQKQTVH